MVPMPKADTVVFSVRMPRELHAQLLAVAQSDYSTVNRSIVVAVQQYVHRMQARRPKAADGR
jgi:predicted HicB family RNase H-like nuclease